MLRGEIDTAVRLVGKLALGAKEEPNCRSILVNCLYEINRYLQTKKNECRKMKDLCGESPEYSSTGSVYWRVEISEK